MSSWSLLADSEISRMMLVQRWNSSRRIVPCSRAPAASFGASAGVWLSRECLIPLRAFVLAIYCLRRCVCSLAIWCVCWQVISLLAMPCLGRACLQRSLASWRAYPCLLVSRNIRTFTPGPTWSAKLSRIILTGPWSQSIHVYQSQLVHTEQADWGVDTWFLLEDLSSMILG